MAETRPPRQARAIIAKGGQAPHMQSAPHMPMAHPASMGMGGGAGGGAGGGNSGLTKAFQGGGQSGDPAVSGDFARNPTTTFLHFPIAGGGLSERGKDQQAVNQRLQGYNQEIQSSMQQGSTFQEAFRSLARGKPEALNDLMSHPTALQSMEHLSQVLGGSGTQSTQVKGADGKLYNVDQNPDGSVSNPRDVGLPGTSEKSQLVNTREGMGRLGSSGDVVPVLDASGNRAQTPQSAAELKAAQQGAGAKPIPARATTKAQTDELANINTVLENVDKLRNSAEATGSLGWGSLNRLAAEHTPLSGAVGEAYNAAYNQIRPALLALTRSPGMNTKATVSAMMDQLPDPAHATAFNMNQVLPNIQLQMRERLGMLVSNYAPGADNRPGAYTNAVALAKVYDAHPVKMQDLQAARAQLQQDPTKLSNAQVSLLKGEADANHLAYDDWTRVERQSLQRGMINTKDYGKLVAANPDLGNIPQNEIVQDPSLKKQVPQDRTQPTAQAPALPPPPPVTTQVPGGAAPSPATQAVPGAGAEAQPAPGASSSSPAAAPVDTGAAAPIPPPADAGQAGQTIPIPPAQQPLAQPAPGQASGIPPLAGGTQALAPSPAAPAASNKTADALLGGIQ